MNIGIDIGGTKIEIAVLSVEGETCFRHRIATPVNDYQATLIAVRDLVVLAEKSVGQRCTIGIGLPGVVSSKRGVMKNANSTWLNGMDFFADIQYVLNRDVRIENDANCFALHEAVYGAGRGEHTVFGVIMGTGVGGGLVIGQQLLSGPNALTGEWGHNPQPWKESDAASVQCYCGKADCIETFLSGPGFMQRLKHDFGDNATVTGIAELAETNGGPALDVMNSWYKTVAAALASVVNLIDPDVIVLGGGLSNIPQLPLRIQEHLHSYVFGGECSTAIRVAEHGDSSGVFGAALLW